MKNDFAKIIFHPQEPQPALPQATRIVFIGGRKFAIFSLLKNQINFCYTVLRVQITKLLLGF